VGTLAIAALAALLVTDGFNLLTVAQLKQR